MRNGTVKSSNEYNPCRDSILYVRTWKNPTVYLTKRPSDEEIKEWQTACETFNSDMNSMMIPSFMKEDSIDRYVTFMDLEMRGSHSEESFYNNPSFTLWRLNEYSPSDHEPENETERYILLSSQMDSVLNCYGNESQFDLNVHSGLSTEFSRILLDEYYQRICKILPEHESALQQEYDAWQYYSDASVKAYDKIIMGPGFQGSSSPIAYYSFIEESILMLSKSVIPLYLSISDPENYSPPVYFSKVSADQILNEYTLFKTALIEQDKKAKDQEFHDPEWYYPLEEQINALEDDQIAWQKWMETRSVVSSSLEENLRNQFDNLTNNIRRRKLIDLKNRYEGFGIMSEYQYEMILHYDCSDKELAEHKYE